MSAHAYLHAHTQTNTLNKKISSIKNNKNINKPNRATQVACASNPNTGLENCKFEDSWGYIARPKPPTKIYIWTNI